MCLCYSNFAKITEKIGLWTVTQAPNSNIVSTLNRFGRRMEGYAFYKKEKVIMN
mgnify:CR=1 FL=1